MQRIKGLISDWKEEDKMVVPSRLLKRFKLAYKRTSVNTGKTVWRRTKVSRQFAPEVRSFERSAVGSEIHDPHLRGLKTESELKIARIETLVFVSEWLGRAACSRSAGPVSDSDITLRSCQHHRSEIARSRHTPKKATFSQTR